MEQTKTKETLKIKRFLYRAFESRDFHDPISLIFDIFYVFVILVAIVLTIFEVTELWEEVKAFEIIEYVIVGLFAIEWFSMLYISDMVFPHPNRFVSALKWFISLESIIDIICLAIFIISFVPIDGLSREVELFLRFITLIKLLRLIKWIKYISMAKKLRKEQLEKEMNNDSNQ